MKVMISLPMNGVKEEDVKNRMEVLKKQFALLHIDVVDSFITDEAPKGTVRPHVFYLGRSIMNFLPNIDAVYFDNGWEFARGCKIEHDICKAYGIKTLYSDFLSWIEDQNNPGGTVRIYTPAPEKTQITGITYRNGCDISIQ